MARIYPVGTTPYISSAEAGAILGVDSSRIRVLVAQGRIKATKFGNVWLVDPKSVAAFRRLKPGRPRKDQR